MIVIPFFQVGFQQLRGDFLEFAGGGELSESEINPVEAAALGDDFGHGDGELLVLGDVLLVRLDVRVADGSRGGFAALVGDDMEDGGIPARKAAHVGDGIESVSGAAPTPVEAEETVGFPVAVADEGVAAFTVAAVVEDEAALVDFGGDHPDPVIHGDVALGQAVERLVIAHIDRKLLRGKNRRSAGAVRVELHLGHHGDVEHQFGDRVGLGVRVTAPVVREHVVPVVFIAEFLSVLLAAVSLVCRVVVGRKHARSFRGMFIMVHQDGNRGRDAARDGLFAVHLGAEAVVRGSLVPEGGLDEDLVVIVAGRAGGRRGPGFADRRRRLQPFPAGLGDDGLQALHPVREARRHVVGRREGLGVGVREDRIQHILAGDDHEAAAGCIVHIEGRFRRHGFTGFFSAPDQAERLAARLGPGGIQELFSDFLRLVGLDPVRIRGDRKQQRYRKQ